jgi:hypothetical protein
MAALERKERTPPIEICPSITMHIKWAEEADKSLDSLEKRFSSYVRDTSEALEDVYGIADPDVAKTVALAITGGYNQKHKSTVIFQKPYTDECDLHLQGYGTVKELLLDRDWLKEQLDTVGIKYKIRYEAMNVNASFKPRGMFSFFSADVWTYLLPLGASFGLFLFNYLRSPDLVGDVLYDLYAAIAALILWIAGTTMIYCTKRKKYVLELPEG